jgi:hypothetical protein
MWVCVGVREHWVDIEDFVHFKVVFILQSRIKELRLHFPTLFRVRESVKKFVKSGTATGLVCIFVASAFSFVILNHNPSSARTLHKYLWLRSFQFSDLERLL